MWVCATDSLYVRCFSSRSFVKLSLWVLNFSGFSVLTNIKVIVLVVYASCREQYYKIVRLIDNNNKKTVHIFILNFWWFFYWSRREKARSEHPKNTVTTSFKKRNHLTQKTVTAWKSVSIQLKTGPSIVWACRLFVCYRLYPFIFLLL